jgi:uncharacterized OB-fold protein
MSQKATLETQFGMQTGVVYAVTTLHRAPTDLFKAQLPYTVVSVTLTNGQRRMARAAQALRIDDAVSLTLENLHGHDVLFAHLKSAKSSTTQCCL